MFTDPFICPSKGYEIGESVQTNESAVGIGTYDRMSKLLLIHVAWMKVELAVWIKSSGDMDSACSQWVGLKNREEMVFF